MTPHRIAIKFMASAESAAAIDLDAFIGLFHRVIQEKSFEGLLLDVADYAHVPQGPGVILIGHEVDYGMDFTGQGPGLLVLRKHFEELSLAEALRDTLQKVLVAVRIIEADGSTGARFDLGGFQLNVFDRLGSPNTESAYEELVKEVAPVAEKLYRAGHVLERTHAEDSRQALALTVSAGGDVTLDALIDRLSG